MIWAPRILPQLISEDTLGFLGEGNQVGPDVIMHVWLCMLPC